VSHRPSITERSEVPAWRFRPVSAVADARRVMTVAKFDPLATNFGSWHPEVPPAAFDGRLRF